MAFPCFGEAAASTGGADLASLGGEETGGARGETDGALEGTETGVAAGEALVGDWVEGLDGGEAELRGGGTVVVSEGLGLAPGAAEVVGLLAAANATPTISVSVAKTRSLISTLS